MATDEFEHPEYPLPDKKRIEQIRKESEERHNYGRLNARATDESGEDRSGQEGL